MKFSTFFALLLCVITFYLILSLSLQKQAVASVSSLQTNDCSAASVWLPLVQENRIIYFDQPWEQEPNDSYERANGPLRSSVDYKGYPDNERDFFSIYMETGGQIIINLKDPLSQGMQLLLYYKSTGEPMLRTYDYEAPFIITYNGIAGWYYILVFTASGHNSTTPYTLEVTYPSPTSQPTPTFSTPIVLPTCTPTSVPTLTPTFASPTSPAFCTPGHLGAGEPITVIMYGNCYYHFNVACAGCGMNEEDNYVVYYSGSTVSVTIPEGSVWQYDQEPVSGQVCDPIDHWPTNLPTFLNLPGVQQLFPCGQLPTSTPTPTNTSTPTPMPTATNTLTATPTNTPTATPKPTTQYGYNFESDTENWTTSEGEFKPITLTTTTQFVYSGVRAFQLVPNLRSDSSEVYRHTETVAYFNNAIPEGFVVPGPYNLTGKLVSCFIYLPSELASGGSAQVYIRLFVKDKDFRNQFSNALDISSSNVNRWLQLALTVGTGDNQAPGFKSTEVNALGIRVELHNGATLIYTGPLYIDHCAIQQP